MSKADYALLQDVIMDADFPDLDLALRRGRHVDRDDGAWYALLTDAQELLEPFYRRYGCELIHKTDGYFYLLPTGEKVSRKQLSATDMLVGQALALLYLDPAAVERGGVVTQEEVVGQLSAVLGTDTLIAAFNPGKRKSKDERIAQRNVRQRVGEAVRRLAGLGFVEVSDASGVRLRSALLRFAEPVRGLSEPAEALAKLVAQGEVALAPEEPGDELDEQDGDVAAEGVADESGERVDRAAAAVSGGQVAHAKRETFAETLSGFAAAPALEAELGGAGESTQSQLVAADGYAVVLDVEGGELRDAADDVSALLDVTDDEPAGGYVARVDVESFEQDAAAVGDDAAPRGSQSAALSDRPDSELSGQGDAEDDVSGSLQPMAAESDAFASADDTSVRRKPDAVDDDALDHAAESGAAESATPEPEDDDRDLDWADIMVPDVVKDDDEEAS